MSRAFRVAASRTSTQGTGQVGNQDRVAPVKVARLPTAVEPNVKLALEQANKPRSRLAPPRHRRERRCECRETGQMKTDSYGQAWLASSQDITALVHAGGAGPAADRQ